LQKYCSIAGPSELPTIFRTTVIPSDTPLDCLGVDSITILNPPTCNKDNPVAIMARLASIKNSVEWNIKRLKNPTVLIIVPAAVGFRLPSLDIINQTMVRISEIPP
jgi:hypothetical protein